IAWLNLNAHEVQWTAGALLAGAFILTLQNPGRWLKVALQLFTAVPISSLYLYQVPGIHHKPLYETSVALIPSFVGSVAGLILSWAWPSDWRA
ncbi:hypothetical protein, partial [Glaesserella parasuis]|uniref:hypothetical protein n=1 Tax=Glaesserella parasuis TaxID=738 RepID=UPI003F39CBF8